MRRQYHLVDGTGSSEHLEALDDGVFPEGETFWMIAGLPGGPYEFDSHEATKAAVRDAWSGDWEAAAMLERASGNPDVACLMGKGEEAEPYILCSVLGGVDVEMALKNGWIDSPEQYLEIERNDATAVFDSDEDAAIAAVKAMRAGHERAREVVMAAQADPKVRRILGMLDTQQKIEDAFGVQIPEGHDCIKTRPRGLSM